ncbi:MAG: Gfo/Idh/MocA family protein [Promethearchaeota archaeon]
MIGAGAIGEVHLLGFRKIKNCEIVAIASRTKEHALKTADKFKIRNIYVSDGWKDMIVEENLDIVSICTPNYLHYPMIMESIKNNINILCEKPICISQNELDSVEKALAKNSIIFFTAFHKRYISIFSTVKESIRKEILGKISFVRYIFTHLGPYTSHKARSKEKWFFNSKKAGGGVLLDLGVHCIDILRYLIGECEKIDGISYNTTCTDIKDEDNCSVLFKFENGVLGNINVSWCIPPTEIIEIYGQKGLIKIDLISKKKPLTILPKVIRKNKYINNVFKQKISKEPAHYQLIEHFVNCVLENKTIDGPTFQDGKKAVEFVLNAYFLKK